MKIKGNVYIFLLYLRQRAAVQIFLFPSTNPEKQTLKPINLNSPIWKHPVEELYSRKCYKKGGIQSLTTNYLQLLYYASSNCAMIFINSLFHSIQLRNDIFQFLATDLISYSWTVITLLKRTVFTSTFDFITECNLDVLLKKKTWKLHLLIYKIITMSTYKFVQYIQLQI